MPTLFAARQFVNHGHVLVNGQRVNIPSYLVREGDIIEVREQLEEPGAGAGSVQQPERDVPDYLTVDYKA